ncbi:MAG: hypothetical protein HY000_24850 [Planctomycetes bacterium]|nr:hypothetical protein [Planctomycetota bacterium]
MDGWEVALWVFAGYLAIVPLVRMMLARRERLVVEFRARMAEERRRRKQQEKNENRGRAA